MKGFSRPVVSVYKGSKSSN